MCGFIAPGTVVSSRESLTFVIVHLAGAFAQLLSKAFRGRYERSF